MHKEFMFLAIGATLAIVFNGIVASFMNPILSILGVTYS